MAAGKHIGLREVRALKPGEIVWDAEVAGFGARRQKSAKVRYVLFYRTLEGRQRWHTIGKHGDPWTPESARKEAKRLIGEVVVGSDPAAEKRAVRKAETVNQLCDLYLTDIEAGRVLTRRRHAKKASTIVTDRGRIVRHIKPLMGHLKVAAVTREDVEQFMRAVAEGKTAARTKTAKRRGLANVRGGRGTASRTVGLLGAIFTYAVAARMRTDNPVRGVMRPADGSRQRRLSDDEYRAFGDGLRSAKETMWPFATEAARFLALTGWRSGEALKLKRSEIDFARRTAFLGDTKTGDSVRPLSIAACDLLRDLKSTGEFIFAASRGKGPMTGFPRFFARIIALAKLPKDVTPHVLRHSFASLANDLGYSDATIGGLIGHKGRSITSRYIHGADNVMLAAADMVSNKTLELMGERAAQAVVVPMTRSGGRAA